MRKSKLNKTTIILVVVFILAPIIFATSRYLNEQSQEVRTQSLAQEHRHTN